jgi:hypothetical protein
MPTAVWMALGVDRHAAAAKRSRSLCYPRLLVVAGSSIIALIAATWLVQRAFNLQLIGG